MPGRTSPKIEDKVVSLFALDLKIPEIAEKIRADGVADGTNVTLGLMTIRRILYSNNLMEKGYHRGRKVSVVEEPMTPLADTLTDAPALARMRYDAATRREAEGTPPVASIEDVSPLSSIMDVDKFIKEANILLTPLEVEHRANGELLGSLRSHLNGLEILAHALSGRDSELAKIKNKQADYQGQIADLNKQIATWQRHAFQRAEGKPSDTSLVDRG